jgi:hypothetical protein
MIGLWLFAVSLWAILSAFASKIASRYLCPCRQASPLPTQACHCQQSPPTSDRSRCNSRRTASSISTGARDLVPSAPAVAGLLLRRAAQHTVRTKSRSCTRSLRLAQLARVPRRAAWRPDGSRQRGDTRATVELPRHAQFRNRLELATPGRETAITTREQELVLGRSSGGWREQSCRARRGWGIRHEASRTLMGVQGVPIPRSARSSAGRRT